MAGCTRGAWATDSDGYFFITGRKKEMIVSSTGKKIYPSRVENLFKMEPLISQVLLVGDRLPYLTALFTINVAAAELRDLKVVFQPFRRQMRSNHPAAFFSRLRRQLNRRTNMIFVSP